MEKYNKIKSEIGALSNKELEVLMCLSDQLDECMNAKSVETRRYERAVLMGMLEAFKLTGDIGQGVVLYYLHKIVDMINMECEE